MRADAASLLSLSHSHLITTPLDVLAVSFLNEDYAAITTVRGNPEGEV
jgi:hypothetical protein